MTRPAWSRLLAAALAVASLCVLPGCVQPPERPLAEIPAVVERERLALALEEKGDPAGALVQWKILATIRPAEPRYAERIEFLRRSIEARAGHLVQEGVASMRQGARESARLAFLKALALDPRNRQALTHLRQLAIQSPALAQ